MRIHLSDSAHSDREILQLARVRANGISASRTPDTVMGWTDCGRPVTAGTGSARARPRLRGAVHNNIAVKTNEPQGEWWGGGGVVVVDNSV